MGVIRVFCVANIMEEKNFLVSSDGDKSLIQFIRTLELPPQHFFSFDTWWKSKLYGQYTKRVLWVDSHKNYHLEVKYHGLIAVK